MTVGSRDNYNKLLFWMKTAMQGSMVNSRTNRNEKEEVRNKI